MKLSLRTLLPAIGIIVLVGVGALLLARRTSTPGTNTANTNVASVPGPTGASEPEGSALNANVAVGSARLVVVKTFRADAYKLLTAAAGKEFVVVKFLPLPDSAATVSASIAESTLTSGAETFTPVSFDVPATKDTQADGAVAFEVPKGKTGFRFHVDKATIDLPL